MIYPQNNRFIKAFFHYYILNLVKYNFRQIKFNTITVSENKAILLIANHFSWWDGFLMYYINHYVFKKKFHVMVIAETVKKVSFIKYMGAFSMSKNSKEMLDSLNYAAQLLNDPANLILIFPQGKLYSNFTGKIIFKKGLLRIVQKAAGNFQAVMAATFIETLQHKKSTVNVYLKNIADSIGIKNINTLQQIYQEHYDDALQQQTKTAI